MNRRLSLAVLLTALVAFGPVSTDLYLPSLPDMTRALATDVATVQLTLSVFVGGFALAMLAHGPLSDRLGRRPVVLVSLVLYVAASAACWAAPSAEALVGARFFQALGACAGPVVGRAVVRDIHGPEGSARVLAYMGAAMALAPLAAPVVGGWLHVAYGWRANFALLALFGALVLWASWHGLAETNRCPDPTATRPARLLANYRTLLRHRGYRAYVLTVGFAFGGLFSWIAGSPFALIEVLGLAPDGFGYAFALVVGGYVAGSLAGARLGGRLGVVRLVRLGGVVAALAAAVGAGLAWSGVETLPAVVGPVAVFFAGCGMLLPNGMAGAIGPFPRMAGAASALLGFVQMAVAALASTILGHVHDGTTRPMMTAILAAALLSLVAFAGLGRRQAA